MSKGRPKTLKYKNYNYNEDMTALVNAPLSAEDVKSIKYLKDTYLSLGVSRGYEYIIKDLYVLSVKHKISTKDLSTIYNVNVRTVQLWLKELGLNRVQGGSQEQIYSDERELSGFQGIINIGERDLPECLINFINYLETIRGKSPNTVAAYRTDLIMFFRFLMIYKNKLKDKNIEFEEVPIMSINNSDLNDIKLSDLYAFLSFTEKQRNNSAYARARKVATLRSFFKFLIGKARIIKENPASDLESPKISKRHPIYLNLEESRTLLNSIEGVSKLRDYCIITIFLNCGLRVSELCGINISDIREDTLTVIGKGNKQRMVYLNETCIRAIEDYLRYRNENFDRIVDKDALFISKNKTRISKRAVELMLKKYLKPAGLDVQKYTPHKLRHTAATLMYKHGNVDIRSLQEILGHENISTTQIYTHVDNQRLRDAINSNPLNE
jgi:site-specific recombinase XerD